MKWHTVEWELKQEAIDMQPLIIYTSGANCGLCKVSQNYMQKYNIPFLEKVAVVTLKDQARLKSNPDEWKKLIEERANNHKEAWKFFQKYNPGIQRKIQMPLIVDHNLKKTAELSGGIQLYIQQNYLVEKN